MATCVVYDAENKPINIIVAELTDTPPDGCRLELLPENAIWDGTQIIIPAEQDFPQENLVSGGGAVDGN